MSVQERLAALAAEREAVEQEHLNRLAEIVEREKAVRAETIAEVFKMMDAAGLTLQDLVDAKKVRQPKSPPKFRNPDNPEQTWTGNGRKPAWFIAALDAGWSENDLLINPVEAEPRAE